MHYTTQVASCTLPSPSSAQTYLLHCDASIFQHWLRTELVAFATTSLSVVAFVRRSARCQTKNKHLHRHTHKHVRVLTHWRPTNLTVYPKRPQIHNIKTTAIACCDSLLAIAIGTILLGRQHIDGGLWQGHWCSTFSFVTKLLCLGCFYFREYRISRSVLQRTTFQFGVKFRPFTFVSDERHYVGVSTKQMSCFNHYSNIPFIVRNIVELVSYIARDFSESSCIRCMQTGGYLSNAPMASSRWTHKQKTHVRNVLHHNRCSCRIRSSEFTSSYSHHQPPKPPHQLDSNNTTPSVHRICAQIRPKTVSCCVPQRHSCPQMVWNVLRLCINGQRNAWQMVFEKYFQLQSPFRINYRW